MNLFQRYGIPGPKPHFLLGNIREFNDKKIKCFEEWEKKYGKMFGFFLGSKPYLICLDVEFIKIMQIKEFKHFANRDAVLPDGGVSHKLALNALVLQKDEEWKVSRSIISTSFSSAKIKNMSSLMEEPIDMFLKNIEKQKEETFDIVEFYKKLIFDIICRTIFGIKTNVQKGENSKLIQSSYRILKKDTSDILINLSICFTESEPIPTYLRNIVDAIRNRLNYPSDRFVFENCYQIIQSRKKSEHNPPDLLHTMIEAEDKIKKLTTDAVIANAAMFMVAGFDTTSNAISWCTHFVAHHPEIQEKIRQEINTHIQNKKEIEYADLQKFQFLDQVISETLRLSTVSVFTISRTCSEDFKYKDMIIPKGVAITVPIPLLHRDPNYWPEPCKFDPDRFSSSNRGNIDPAVYQPFGAGPRMCVGMRMAQTIVKLTVAKLIREFKIEPVGPKEMEEDYSLFVIHPKNGVLVKAIPINSK